MTQRVQRPPSSINLPEVPPVGSQMFRFLVAIKQRLENLFIKRNGPTLPFGHTIEGHTILTADRNTSVPLSINGEQIGTGLQVHQGPDQFSFILLTNGSPDGVAFFGAVKKDNEASLVVDRTSTTATYLPLTFYTNGVTALHIASTLTAASSATLSPVFIRQSGQLKQIKFVDDGSGHFLLYV